MLTAVYSNALISSLNARARSHLWTSSRSSMYGDDVELNDLSVTTFGFTVGQGMSAPRFARNPNITQSSAGGDFTTSRGGRSYGTSSYRFGRSRDEGEDDGWDTRRLRDSSIPAESVLGVESEFGDADVSDLGKIREEIR